MKTKDVTKSLKIADGQIGREKLREESPTYTRELILLWAEYQRRLHAEGKLSAAHVRALMAIPGWTWELTRGKCLADLCSLFLEQEASRRYLASRSSK